MKKISLVIMLLGLITSGVFAKGEITKIFAHKKNATSSNYKANGKQYKWGIGKNLIIDGFEYQGKKYKYTALADKVVIRRSDNAYASGDTCGLFVQKKNNKYNKKYQYEPSYPKDCDMASVMGGRVINIGALDLFKNKDSGQYAASEKNIERVDFIVEDGIVAPKKGADLAKAGHVVTEKSGNNPIQIAAILELDEAGNPSQYGPLVKILGGGTHRYGHAKIYLPNGEVIDRMQLAFLNKDKAGKDKYPHRTNDSNEFLGISFVSLQDLGISAGQKYYGFSYFGRDVTDSMDLVDYDSFPKDTDGDTADPYGGVASYFIDEEIDNNNICKNSFPSVINVTEEHNNNDVQLNWNTVIGGSDTIFTKKWTVARGVKCNGKTCKKSNTLATKLDFEVLAGDAHDGELKENNTINDNKQYKSVVLPYGSTLDINGNVIIKVKNGFEIGGNSTFNVNGNVVIYAKHFNMNYGCKVNINGSLKIVSNGKVHFINQNSINGATSQNLTVLAKGNVHITSQTDLKGLFYSDKTIEVISGSKVSGVLTGKKVIVSGTVNYDKSVVDTFCTPQPPAPEPTIVVAEYRFDKCNWNGSEDEIIDSKSENNGKYTDTESVSSEEGIINRAASFSGDESIEIEQPDFTLGSEPFSISFWMKLDKMPTRAYMAIMNKDFELYVGKNGKIYLNPKNGSSDLISANTIGKGTWYYLTITSDGSQLLLYVDGKEQGRISAINLGKNGADSLMIGQTPWSENEDPLVEPFVGQIDEMKIFDQAISGDRIKQLIALDNAGKNINGSSREKLVCLDPVGCTSKAIVIDDTKYVHQIDLVTGEKNTTVMSTEQVNHASVNGFGYNVKDGFFWGSNQGKGGYLVKIGKDTNGQFSQKKVGPVEGLPTNKGTYIGDIDHNGMLYLYYKNTPRSGVHTMYIVNLNKESADYLKVVDSFILDNIAVADMAFNPIDKQLYAIEKDRDLYKIDVRNHTVRPIKAKVVGGNNDTFGSSFFDAQGFFYAIKNTSREIYRIDISDPSKIRSLVFSTLVNEDVQNVNIDGGRCNLKPIYIDYGDAPDSSSYSEGDGTGVMNYKTLTSDDGPRHRLPADENETNVYLGTSVSSESDAKSSGTDYNYDNDDGIVDGIKPLYTNMYTYTLQLRVTNDRNITANLVGWIDFNRNGRFETKEGVFQVVAPNSQGVYTLKWNVPKDITAGATYARFRVTTDPLMIEESDSYGPKSDGEVEDWEIMIKEGSLYDVWDVDSDVDYRVIKTKQVNQLFSLTIASINRAGSLIESTGSDIQVRIVSKKDGSVLSDYKDVNLSTEMQKTILFTERPENTKPISKVTREAQVQIRFVDERNITREVNATDLFAIRPDHFEIVTPDDALIAGKDFNITLLAKDANDIVVDTFTESAENYLLDINETKTVVACRDLNVTVSKKETRDFENGESKATIRYPDIGELRFKVYEKPGSEYAVVDSSDTDEAQRLIAADEKTYGINPKRIALEWQLENGDSVNGVTYFNSYDANDADFNTMYAKLGLKITVKNAKNEAVKKFTDGCYAQDIDISLKYQIDSNDTTDDYLVMASYEDRNGTFNTALSRLPDFMSKGEHKINDFKLEKALFQEGIGIKTVKFNFNRNASLPLNPILLKIEDINATLDTLSDIDNTSKSLKFFYVRAHIPDQDVVGKEMDAKVFYEVYCKECDMSKFGIANLPESMDSIYWYQLSSVNESEYFDFENPAMTNGFGAFPSGSISAVTHVFNNIEKRNSGRILHIEVNKSPQTVRVKYKPKKYLVFNPFNSSATLHGFTASFMPKEKSWAGKGDTGYTVDTAIAPRNNMNIIDW